MATAPRIITRSLPGLPRRTLSPAQQMEALRRVQAQAEQRVKLGTQMFKAVEARTTQHQATLDQIHAEQARLHEEIQADAARSLQSYEQKIVQIDDPFTQKLKAVEDRLDALAANWKDAEGRIGYMMRRAEVLLDQTRYAVRDGTLAAPSVSPPRDDANAPPAVSAADPAAEAPPVRYIEVVRQLHERQLSSENAADHAA